MRDPGIYALTCRPSGETYIGSSVDMGRRRKRHLSVLRSGEHFNPRLQRAWDQLAPEDFEWRVLERCPEVELLGRERHWYGAWKGLLFNRHPPQTPSEKTGLIAEYLRSVLHYDPETGFFTWRERSDLPEGRARNAWNARYAGRRAGALVPSKHTTYVTIRINNRHYRAHRLAWLYVTGEWPSGDIDHEDGDGTHNWFENLRDATRTQNNGNTRRPTNNTSGYKGVVRSHNGKRWVAYIRINGRLLHLGTYDTPQLAHAAYTRAAKAHFGDFARPG